MEQKKINIAVMDAEVGTLYVLPVTAPPPGSDVGLEEWIEAQLTAHNLDNPSTEWMEVKQIRLDLSAMLIHIASYKEAAIAPPKAAKSSFKGSTNMDDDSDETDMSIAGTPVGDE